MRKKSHPQHLTIFLVRLLAVVVCQILQAVLYSLIWIFGRRPINGVLVALAPWMRRQYDDAVSALGRDYSLREVTTKRDVWRGNLGGLLKAKRLRRRNSSVRLAVALATDTVTSQGLLYALQAAGLSWMVLKRPVLRVGDVLRVQILDIRTCGLNETRTAAFAEANSIRIEIRDEGSLPDIAALVNVRIVEFRGRSAIGELADTGNKLSNDTKERRGHVMILAAPWFYAELALTESPGFPVLMIEEIRIPGVQLLTTEMRALHRLVLRNGKSLGKAPLFWTSLDFGKECVLAAIIRGHRPAPDYPVSPEWQKPKNFSVAAPFKALCVTVFISLRNRSQCARFWKRTRSKGSTACPGSVLYLTSKTGFASAVRLDGKLLHIDESIPLGNMVGGSIPLGPTEYVNSKGEAYCWVGDRRQPDWGQLPKEPRRFRNRTSRFWKTRTKLSRTSKILSFVLSRAFGGPSDAEFARLGQGGDAYLSVLEKSGFRGWDALRRRRVTAQKSIGYVIRLDLDDTDELQKGDFLRLYSVDGSHAGNAQIRKVTGRAVDVEVSKSIRVASVVLALTDFPVLVQRRALNIFLSDRSRDNFVVRNLRASGAWIYRVPLLRDAHGVLNIRKWLWSSPSTALYDKRLAGKRAAKRAIGLITRLSPHITLIQGPPGTGKTTLIVELIQHLVLDRHLKVLMVSQSNLAADEALARTYVANSRILSVRVGAMSRIAEEVKHLHYDWYDSASKERLRTRLVEKGVKSVLRIWDAASLFALLQDENVALEEKFKDMGEWERSAAHVDLVCATCIGIATPRAFPFSVREYDVVILDEASRATLTESLVPLRLGRQWILVGDHKQLPPTVPQELREALDSAGTPSCYAETSLFEMLQGEQCFAFPGATRMTPTMGRRVMLDVQHRMHPEIAAFISEVFYGAKDAIASGPATELRGIRLSPFDDPICVVDTRRYPDREWHLNGTTIPANREKRGRDRLQSSLGNVLEVWLIANILGRLAEATLSASDTDLGQILDKDSPHGGEISLGVITPYREQQSLIRAALAQRREWGRLRYDSDTVATIDSYQGKERDIILFCCVRTHSGRKANLQFLKDMRRLNVAFSRTRHKLILIGHGQVLAQADRELQAEKGQEVFHRFLSRFTDQRGVQHVYETPDALIQADIVEPYCKRGNADPSDEGVA